MKALFLSGRPYYQKGTTGTFGSIQAFSKRHEVKVIAKPPNKSSITNKIDVDFIPLKPVNGFSLISKANLVKDFDPHLVWIFNYPGWWESATTLRAILPKARFILDIQTPLLMDGVQRELVQRSSQAAQSAIDQVFTLSKDSLFTWIPGFHGEFVEYPLGIDVDLFAKHAGRANVVARGEPKKYVYIGALDAKRDVETLVEGFIGFALEQCAVISLDVYGSGNAVETLNRIIKERGAQAFVRLRGLVDIDTLAKVLPTYDVGLAWVPQVIFGHSPSLKVLEYMASGLKVLASDTQA